MNILLVFLWDIFERCAKRNTFDIYNYKIKMNKREPGYFCGGSQ
jgi:hypothetical protein